MKKNYFYALLYVCSSITPGYSLEEKSKYSFSAVADKVKSLPKNVLYGVAAASVVVVGVGIAAGSGLFSSKKLAEIELTHSVTDLFKKGHTAPFSALSDGELVILDKEKKQLFSINKSGLETIKGKRFQALTKIDPTISDAAYYLCLDDRKIYKKESEKMSVAQVQTGSAYILKETPMPAAVAPTPVPEDVWTKLKNFYSENPKTAITLGIGGSIVAAATVYLGSNHKIASAAGIAAAGYLAIQKGKPKDLKEAGISAVLVAAAVAVGENVCTPGLYAGLLLSGAGHLGKEYYKYYQKAEVLKAKSKTDSDAYNTASAAHAAAAAGAPNVATLKADMDAKLATRDQSQAILDAHKFIDNINVKNLGLDASIGCPAGIAGGLVGGFVGGIPGCYLGAVAGSAAAGYYSKEIVAAVS